MSRAVAFDISGSIVRVGISLSKYQGNGSTCPLTEHLLINFLKMSPLLACPWIFNDVQKRRRVYCFLFNFSDMEEVFAKGLEHIALYTKGVTSPAVTRVVTMGSQDRLFEELMTSSLSKFNSKSRFKPQYISHSEEQLPEVRVAIIKRKELGCVVDALDYFNTYLPNALYQYRKTGRFITDAKPEPPNTEYETATGEHDPNFYPYLLVNVKAGVAFHRVMGKNSTKRVGGSTIGLATFLGLAQHFCGSDTPAYDIFLESELGDQTKVDMLVSDIYGGGYATLGLSGSMVASTFGKLQRVKVARRDDSHGSQSPNMSRLRLFPSFDIEQELPTNFLEGTSVAQNKTLQSTSIKLLNNSGQITAERQLGKEVDVLGLKVLSVLETEENLKYTFVNRLVHESSLRTKDTSARPNKCFFENDVHKSDVFKSLLSMTTFNIAQLAYLNAILHDCKRIIVIGYYVDMPQTLAAIQHCIQTWSNGTIEVSFIRLAPYLGAIGAALGEARRSEVTKTV